MHKDSISCNVSELLRQDNLPSPVLSKVLMGEGMFNYPRCTSAGIAYIMTCIKSRSIINASINIKYYVVLKGDGSFDHHSRKFAVATFAANAVLSKVGVILFYILQFYYRRW